MERFSMRITVEIDEKQLNRIQKVTGIHKKSPAVRQAIANYLQELDKKRFLERVLNGETDYALTNDQVETLSTYDID